MKTSHPNITNEKDRTVSKVTVRLRCADSLQTIGTGVIYKATHLKEKLYVLTAAHTLYFDGDNFQAPRSRIVLEFYNAEFDSYFAVLHQINHSLAYADEGRDVAVLAVEEYSYLPVKDKIPHIECLNQRGAESDFIFKGFPEATQGQELATIHSRWKQELTRVRIFQLELQDDYEGWSLDGFSGSGAFLYSSGDLYLYGIFSRYREEGTGRVIYCQYLERCNEILKSNFLPAIKFTYLGENGINSRFFENQVDNAIQNLGPRFNSNLNFRLPVARLFNDLARDDKFRGRLTNAFDRWLTDGRSSYHRSKSPHLEEIENLCAQINIQTLSWLIAINWQPDNVITIESALAPLIKMDEQVKRKKDELFDLRYLEEKETPLEIRNNYQYKAPFEAEISRLRSIGENNDALFSGLDAINTNLSNYPTLIIRGEAGCGKSHLLGDISSERIKKGLPTLLLLGQHFKSKSLVWDNFVSQIGLKCTKDQLLGTLNNIGEQIGSRVLILIDALNEGAGRAVWPDEISGFIQEISKYPFIGLCFTIRSTYYEVIIPENVSSSPKITQWVHEGFKGNEYEALQLFSKYYELEQPSFPILSPEFTNPLFLQLVCEGVRNSKDKVFPQGFQGVSKVFDMYLDGINKKLIVRRKEYLFQNDTIKRSVERFAGELITMGGVREMPFDKAMQFFSTEFSSTKYLFQDLIHENVFIQNFRTDLDTERRTEIILFSFERFGDFVIANEMLRPFSHAEEVRLAFQEDETLGNLLHKGWWYNRGLLEAMAILLPEKYQLEIFEVFNWLFVGIHENIMGNMDELINHYLLDSLKWRRSDSIDNNKLTAWIRGEHFKVHDYVYFNVLNGLTTLKNHPFNADRFHKFMLQFSMADRDAFWQPHLRFYAGDSDDGNAFPLKRLIQWAWIPNISLRVDREIARLTALTLTWVLSSTFRQLRDQATKALVNLLEEQPDALIKVLTAFKEVNDIFLLERLYAVAYACALRTSSSIGLQNIAQFTFDTIFKEGNPPIHVLLRDYARNVVELALFRQLPIEGDMKLIRPPYNSPMPENIPTDEELKGYLLDTKAKDFGLRRGRLHNFIKTDIMDWDFTKIIDSGLRDFCPVSFRMEAVYEAFLKRINKQQRTQNQKLDTSLETGEHLQLSQKTGQLV